MAEPHPPSTDRERMLEVVEEFALVLHTQGVQRMPARVFAYVLVGDAEQYTAADLASGLGVSPAAISGAVRYLTSVGMLAKGRKPGARADHYHVFDDEVWSTIYAKRSSLVEAYLNAAAKGVEVMGPDTRGGRRMWESYEFFKFMQDEMDGLLQRWKDHWAQVRREHDDHPPQFGSR